MFVGNMQNKSGSFCHQICLGNSGLDHVKLIYLFALDFLRSSHMLMAIVTLLRGHSMQSLPNLLNHRLLLGKASHQGISILQTIFRLFFRLYSSGYITIENKSIFQLTTLEPATDYNTLKKYT